MPVLELKAVSKNFGGMKALTDVSFDLNENELLGLIGPNGAGKSTLINCITGVYKPSSGTIKLMGRDLAEFKPYQICKQGIARTFQIPRPFGRITVKENIMVALREPGDRAQSYLELVGLGDKQDVLAGTLSFPNRRKLEIARALATRPIFMLLDEVMSGLNPTEMAEMVSLVKMIQKEKKITILWVEHVMRAIMENADRCVVLNQGTKMLEGSPKDVASDKRVIEIYLGEKYDFKGDQIAGDSRN